MSTDILITRDIKVSHLKTCYITKDFVLHTRHVVLLGQLSVVYYDGLDMWIRCEILELVLNIGGEIS
jgi:hypothetical protein